MDPTKQFLNGSPRNLSADAFFASDRSTTAVTRQVTGCDLPRDAKGTCNNSAQLSFGGWRNRFTLSSFTATNPLPQTRMTAQKGGVLDKSVQGWTHDVTYHAVASSSASGMAGSSRLRVSILFGTGSEAYRHGLCGIVDVVQQPTLLIIVPGIEPQYQIQFKNPTNGQTKTLAANTRWGVGITDSSIQAIVAQVIGRQAAYDIVVCAAYSTGYLGFSGSVSRQLFSLAAIERAIVFDCLYAQLGQSLLAIRQAKSSAKIVCYVASLGGNSFQPGQAPSFQSLLLGGNPAFNYINLFFNTNYYSVASARIINEAVSPGNLIISAIPKPFETAFNNLTAKLPPRGTIVSDAGVYKAVKGTMPSNATALSDFSRTNASLVAPYFAQNTIVHQCIQNAELLGWSTPPGEEWHDMLLVEFSWEYLV